MNNPLATPRITRTLLLIAALFALWSPARGLATAVGAGLSLLNWLALRWLAGRILDNGQAVALEGGASSVGKALASLLLFAKIGLLMGLVFVLINRLQLDAIGLVFGLGVLFVGPVVAGLMAAAPRPLSPSAANAAREER